MPRRVDVKAIRDKIGITQGQLAMHIWGDKSKYRERAISRWENGHNDPSPMVVQHLKRIVSDHEAKQKNKGDGASLPDVKQRKAPTATDPASDEAMPKRGPSRAHTALPGLS